ncbi:hypothetical protein V8F20_007991 [Naviculisporaceae sp. PSN 640]
MADNTTVLITGANRGIGRGVVELFLKRANYTIVAAVRDPSSSSSVSLKTLPTGENSKVIVVKIDSISDTDPWEAVEQIKAEGVDHLDIVIANAGISEGYARVEAIKLNEIREFFEVNTLGPLKLYEATYPLLKAAFDKKGEAALEKAPMFIGVTSAASSIHNAEQGAPFIIGAYGASKAALNFLVKKAHVENDWLNAFVIDPGFTQTEMGNAGAKYFGLEQAFVTVKDSTEGIVRTIDNGTKTALSGKYIVYDGSEGQF